MIKLIATDLDGTLLYPRLNKKLITEENKSFLQRFKDNGGEVIFISGRNQEIAKRLSSRVGKSFDMIGCNGGFIMKDNFIIEEDPLDLDSARSLFEENVNNDDILAWSFFTSKNNMILVPNAMNKPLSFIYTFTLKYIMHGYNGTFRIAKKNFDDIIQTPDEKIYKMMAITGIGKKAKEEAKILSLKCKEKYSDKFDSFWSSSAVEFTKKNINKANALKNFLNMIKLSSDEVAVIGDSGNDVPLFKEFKHSFVMSHAPSEVKKEAKHILNAVYEIEDYLREV